MADEWIMEVLCDLRAFARKNGMPELATELDNTVAVAARELGPRTRRAEGRAPEEPGQRSAGCKRG